MSPKKSISFLVVLAVLGGILLAACGPQTVATPTQNAPEEVIPTEVPPNVLTIFHPESPDTFNIHLSRSIKNLEPARIVYEPLAAFDKDGQLVPILADGIPTLENGQRAADGKSIIWKLRAGVTWSDGERFTADDVVFTYSYITDPNVKAATLPIYAQVASVTAEDDLTVKIVFKDANPAWALPFVGNGGVIFPRHIYEKYSGKNAADAPANLMPVGTGPYIVKEPGIKPQEVLLLGSQVVKTTKIVFEPNPNYRDKNAVFFQRIVWRGGGTVDEAARLLFKEGSLDMVYVLDTANPATLAELTQYKNNGKVVSAFGSIILRILLNRTDPNKADENGEYSSINVPHPLLSDKKFRQALAYAANRNSIAQLFGETGRPTNLNLIAPPQYQSTNVFYEYNLEKAKAVLDEAGYLDKDGDGFREKDGVNIKLVFQSLPDASLQQTQKIIQRDLREIGIDTELRTTDASILVGPGLANPDSAYRFNSDMTMFQIRSQSPDPSFYMAYWKCSSRPQKANDWKAGLNFERWCDPKYDELLQQANLELDTAKRTELFKQLNDMLVEDVAMIPLVWRANALGISQKLAGLDPTPWDSNTWNIQSWSFQAPQP